jgi:hypothetical protein
MNHIGNYFGPEDDLNLLERIGDFFQRTARGLPGYETAKGIAYGIADPIADATRATARGVADYATQNLSAASQAYLDVPRGAVNIAGGEGSAPDRTIAGWQQGIGNFFGEPQGMAGSVGRFTGHMAPFVAAGAGAGTLGGALLTDFGVDAAIGAAAPERATVGTLRDMAQAKDLISEGGIVDRAVDPFVDNPLLRGVGEGVVGLGANLLLAKGLPAAYRGLRGMGESGAVPNPAVRPGGVPGEVNSGMRGRWYSRARRAIEQAPQDRATAEQWQGMIRKAKEGVSESEREWSGLDEFLQSRAGQQVTRDELLEQVGPGIGLTETVRGAADPALKGELDQAWDAANRRAIEVEHAMDQEFDIGMASMGNGTSIYDRTREVGGEYVRIGHLGEDGELRFTDAVTPEQRVAVSRWSEARGALEELMAQRDDLIYGSRPKYESYTQPGGENYRETLIQLGTDRKRVSARQLAERWVVAAEAGDRGRFDPGEIEAVRREMLNDPRAHAPLLRSQLRPGEVGPGGVGRPPQGDFTTSHFDEPNILAHLRTTDRNVGGDKTLFIEEIQSDWHQAGRDKGYRNPARAEQLESELDDIRAEYTRIGDEMMEKARGASPSPRDFPDSYRRMEELRAREDELMRARDAATDGVPDAPLKGTDEWVGLSFRRALQDAAEGGYDRVAWASGEQAADLYDLRKQVSRVEWDGEYLNAFDLNGNRVIRESVSDPNKLPDYIGKDAARRLTEQPEPGSYVLESGVRNVRETYPTYEAAFAEYDKLEGFPRQNTHIYQAEGPRSIEGDDLAVGGQGMDEFYNRIVPKAVQREAKRLGVEIEPVRIAGDVYSETPTMRQLADAGYDIRHDPEYGIEVYGPDGQWLSGPHSSDITAREEATKIARFEGDLPPAITEPTNLSIRITPEAREKILNEGMRLGQAVPEIPASMAGGLGGAAVGAALDEEDPLRGMALGGALGLAGGAAAPRTIAGTGIGALFGTGAMLKRRRDNERD